MEYNDPVQIAEGQFDNGQAVVYCYGQEPIDRQDCKIQYINDPQPKTPSLKEWKQVNDMLDK